MYMEGSPLIQSLEHGLVSNTKPICLYLIFEKILKKYTCISNLFVLVSRKASAVKLVYLVKHLTAATFG